MNAQALLGGGVRALGRAITLVENGAPEARSLLRDLYLQTGQAHVVGITGPPGAGKSTLVDQLAVAFRRGGHRVAVVAVDPSSPFTGGAILGDRIRLQGARAYPDIYFRSVAARGHAGGLADATSDIVTLLDGVGFQVVLLETVGTGQSEVEVMELAHTTVVVAVPGLGDDVQAIKAGILEIGDIFAVNKADREGSDATVANLDMMLDLADVTGAGYRRPRHGSAMPGEAFWRPPVLRLVAVQGTGVDALVAAIQQHLVFLRDTGRWELRRQSDAAGRLRRLIVRETTQRVLQQAKTDGSLQAWVERVAAREVDPYTAAHSLLEHYWAR